MGQIIVTLALFFLLIIPIGKYLYNVISGEKSFADKIFNNIDNLIYKITKVKREEMSWKKYAVTLIVFNLVMVIIAYAILRLQGILFLNPNKI